MSSRDKEASNVLSPDVTPVSVPKAVTLDHSEGSRAPVVGEEVIYDRGGPDRFYAEGKVIFVAPAGATVRIFFEGKYFNLLVLPENYRFLSPKTPG